MGLARLWRRGGSLREEEGGDDRRTRQEVRRGANELTTHAHPWTRCIPEPLNMKIKQSEQGVGTLQTRPCTESIQRSQPHRLGLEAMAKQGRAQANQPTQLLPPRVPHGKTNEQII